MDCWQCGKTATQTGIWEWTETVAVVEYRHYEDDYEEEVVDRPVRMVAWCWRCGACGLGFITDSVGIGLGTEQDYGGNMEHDPRWQRIAPDPQAVQP